MNRIIRNLSLSLLAVAAVAGFGLITSCNITGGGASGARGGLNVLLTDGPTDEWSKVIVVLKSVSLHRHDGNSWEDVWTADPANPDAGTINLIDLSGVSQILAAAKIPVGTYNQLKLVINTDPAKITLVDDQDKTIDPANITVVDPSGKGEIKVDLSPAITVAENATTNLIVDFDLAHPLSIVNLDGKVVISLKVRHKALPRHLNSLQFARTTGDLTAAALDGTNFTIKTLQAAEITFNVNLNTIYVDADTNLPGNFAGLSALVASKGAALVASNMNADGSFYARRVWYAAKIDTLPQFTPEGLVRRVGDTWLRLMKKETQTESTGDDHHCDWDSETVFVDANTTWTFQNIAMGTGTSVLHYIAKGFRVEVTFVDPAASPKVAASINVHSAHAEGLVTNATLDNFTFGWRDHTRTMVYSGIADHTFGWWFYGLPSGRSTVLQDLVDSVDQARAANLWVFAHAGLYWDQANTRWVVENLVLAPVKLHDFTKISTGYTVANGYLGVSTYDCWDESVPVTMNVMLDTTGDLQTVVGSFVWTAATNLVTFTLPVQPAEWEALLTPAVNKVKIWVRPVKATDGTYSWHAYSVIAYQFIR
jgi:hypothetical protein